MYDSELSIHRIVDIDRFALPLQMLFPTASLEGLQSQRRWLEPAHVDFDQGLVLLTVQSHLLRFAGLNILIDTCVGEHKERPRRVDWHRRAATGYLDRLAACGLRPDDVDVVLCTHLHADHVGWNTKLESGRWMPTFPKARYLIGRNEYAHWQDLAANDGQNVNHGSFDDSVNPIVQAGLAHFVDEGFDVAKGLRLQGLPGHTPGQVGLSVENDIGQRVLFCGDAIHSPLQVYQPSVSSRFCTDPLLAEKTRLHLLDEAVASGALVVPAHLRDATGMRIHRQGTSFLPDFVP